MPYLLSDISLNTPLYHKVNGKRFIVATLGQDGDYFYLGPYQKKGFYAGPWRSYYHIHREYPQFLPVCRIRQPLDFKITVENISFVRFSSFLSRIQRYVGDDLCLFERMSDGSVGLVPALDRSVDQLP